ncbi:hypothetical protein XBKB1_1590005 [Xenorhabdus bovienii str. kraussei Becker Underwood]|uniref:Uncharacterized protein n=1 Tax=Xenorhabdus bovienii str. kraussei Becker Underwood TaxID=1398204 RepID=A0A077PFW8_XENBV|nr:hypothetical protein XBKB1_1590005 [Xenorhabdus bovienii str. kraussei Becker Underwood]
MRVFSCLKKHAALYEKKFYFSYIINLYLIIRNLSPDFFYRIKTQDFF